jgi:hypothetical protein
MPDMSELMLFFCLLQDLGEAAENMGDTECALPDQEVTFGW